MNRETPEPEYGSRWKAWLAPLFDVVVAVTLLRGVALHGGQPATMLVAGRTKRVRWLAARFFAGEPAREPMGHVPAWRIARTLRQARATADLAVVHVARVSAARLGLGDDYLPVPDWIGMRLAAPFDLAKLAHRSRSLADDLRRIRQARWTSEISHRAADLAAFHGGMYAPFTRIRHGPEAHVQPLRRLRRAFRRGGILWVSRDGERVAGCLFERRHDTLAAVALGVVRGDPARMKEGAIPAVYAQLIELARSSRCADIDFRGSRPSLDDGLTRFKRKWGAAVYDRPDVHSTTLVHWNRMNPVVEAFLAHTSLVFRDGGGLSALAVAGPGERDAGDASATCERLGVPGLRRMIVLTATPPSARAATGICVPMPLGAVGAGPRALLTPAQA